MHRLHTIKESSTLFSLPFHTLYHTLNDLWMRMSMELQVELLLLEADFLLLRNRLQSLIREEEEEKEEEEEAEDTARPQRKKL